MPIILTQENIYTFLPEKNVLVLFYANWCDHCHELLPDFAELASKLAGKTLTAQIDCMESPQSTNFCRRIGVREFPSFIHFNNNRMMKYYGDRSMWDLEDFSTRRVQELWIDQSREAFKKSTLTGRYLVAGQEGWENMALLVMYGILTSVVAVIGWFGIRKFQSLQKTEKYGVLGDLPLTEMIHSSRHSVASI